MDKEITYKDKPWVKNYDPGVAEFATYEDLCVGDFVDRSAERFPDRAAAIFQGYKLSYIKLKDMVDRFASFLDRVGIKRGDHVSIILPNIIQCIVGYFAVQRIGAVAVMHNPLYTDREFEGQLNYAKSKLIVTIDLLGNRIIDLMPKTFVKSMVYASIGDYLPFINKLLFPLVGKKRGLAADVKPAQNVYKFTEVIKANSPISSKAKVSIEDVSTILFTGGSTGTPKGVMLTHSNLSKQVQQIHEWAKSELDASGPHIFLGALPFFHSFGISTVQNLAAFLGHTIVLVPKPQPPFLLDIIKKFRPTFAPIVPTMIIGMLEHPDIKKTDLSCIRACLSGSAPLPVEKLKEFEEITGSVILEGFGQTESSPVTHVNPFTNTRKIGSIGMPISDTMGKIVDLADPLKELPVGEEGELALKGPQIMKGYLDRAEETAKTIIDGWLYTGDIAKMDSDGYFYIVDRKKDMIISGGFNVYPREIEEVFHEHPKVSEASAIGVPHPTRGEQVTVCVVLKEGETATEKELIDFCKDKLAKYKLPTKIEFYDELPKTNVGKILKRELRKMHK